jgi:mannose-1-phosphate guanylyltransferase
MAAEGQLYGMTLENNFWYDIGQSKDYLIGQDAFLKYYKHQPTSEEFDGNVLIHETAKVDSGAKVGPNVVIGAGCHVKKV